MSPRRDVEVSELTGDLRKYTQSESRGFSPSLGYVVSKNFTSGTGLRSHSGCTVNLRVEPEVGSTRLTSYESLDSYVILKDFPNGLGLLPRVGMSETMSSWSHSGLFKRKDFPKVRYDYVD